MTISERIREARKALALTQGQLAAECGVRIGTVNRWENGSLPDPRNMLRLAEVLGIEVTLLIPKGRNDV
jgi:transcriptional regulator with XRE-family HTH domain